MHNIGGFGTQATIIALSTFPMGFRVSQFADDEDAIKAKEIEPFGYEMLYDGSIFPYSKNAPVEVSVSVIAGSEDDTNLKILLNSKTSRISLLPFDDVTSMIITYPNAGRVILSNGTIIRGPALDTVQAVGRRSSNTYTFVFGSNQGFQSTKQGLVGVAQGFLGAL